MSKNYLNIMKNLKLDQIYAHEELDVNNWSQWDPNKYLIDKKIIKKMSKNYLNIIKNLKLHLAHASGKLDINNWSPGDPKKYPYC